MHIERLFMFVRWHTSYDGDTLFDRIPINAYGKLFGMLLGLGAWATLPAVIGGYIGNPWRAQPWIEDAMAQGSAKGRWPGTGLVVETGRASRRPRDFR